MILLLIVLAPNFISLNSKTVHADELSDTILDQMNNIDLSELDKYFDSLGTIPEGKDIYTVVVDLLNGRYDGDYDSIIQYLFSTLLVKIKDMLPTMVALVAIAIFCGVMQNLRSGFSSEGVSDVIFFACFSCVVLMLSKSVIGFYNETKSTIENLSSLSAATSPIILTLMTAVGANVSASVYTPTVAFLAGTIMNLALTVLLPMIGTIAIFSTVSSLTGNLNLTKFADCANSIVKWIIGITITVFTLFMSVQGITSATFDGVSIKAAKYTISNSIPIVGGLLRDGFDIVVAGSVLIKNAVGVSVIIALFYTIVAPITGMIAFSLLLKIVCAVSESVSDARISNVCNVMSKFVTYLIAITLMVGLMFFIIVLLMIFSANAFV